MSNLTARFLAGLRQTSSLGLAVSGGGDSMAMLHLAVAAGLRPAIVTVNHGLRPEAAAEADLVAQVAQGLGLAHQTLHWQGWDHRGNLQDAARKARRGLMADWAVQNGIVSLALGHTQDDIAETFLMRLARGAGVDGLAAMSPLWAERGILWQRPMLGLARADLRVWLSGRGLEWVEDASNQNTRFDRVKARLGLVTLRPMGLTSERIAEVATHLAEARLALDSLADQWAAATLREEAGTVCIDPALWTAPAETQRRVILRVLLWIAPAEYAPRGAQITQLVTRLGMGQAATLAGVRFIAGTKGPRALREIRAAAPRCGAHQIWDGRWRISGAVPEGAELGPLGTNGLAQCPAWRDTGLPRPALLASPALWLRDQVVCAPFAGLRAEAGGVMTLQPLLSVNTDALSH